MHGLMVRVQPMKYKVMGSNLFGSISCYHDTIPPFKRIEDLVCPVIDDGSLQEELEHSPNSSLLTKYVLLDYILAN